MKEQRVVISRRGRVGVPRVGGRSGCTGGPAALTALTIMAAAAPTAATIHSSAALITSTYSSRD
eukprot:scaffold73262_cov32-Tisochrysis_lutea.AAC.5